MCDGCNGYFGNTLEPELIRHPSVAWAIQKARVPGKAGKVRSVVGNIVRTGDPDPGFRVDIAPIKVSQNPEGRVEITVLPLLDPNFNLLRFRRALHLVAFNCLAYQLGAAEALHPMYDRVRTYVRRPFRRDEAWPFAVVYDPPHDQEVDAELFAASELGSVMRIGLYTHSFYVDLLNRGTLEAWMKAQGLSRMQFVSPTDDYPRSPKTSQVPPQ
jgi:hypothetical protein